MLTFQCDVSVPAVPLVGDFVGVDVGLEYFLSTSAGVQVERPNFFVRMQRKLKSLQRRLKRMQLGSSNWKKQQRQIARLHERITNTRKDFHYQQAHRLCNAGHGQFLNGILPWVCFKRGKGFIKEPAAGTSQECPGCGQIAKKLLFGRWHRCECGCAMPRDVASAIVIKNRAVGRTVLEKACGDGLTGAVALASV